MFQRGHSFEVQHCNTLKPLTENSEMKCETNLLRQLEEGGGVL